MQKTKKKTCMLAVVIVLSLLALLAACGKSEFGITESTDTHMTITAANADKDAYFTVGSLEAADGEQIVITSNLEKGMVKVEVFKAEGEQSIDKLPEISGEPVLTGTFGGLEGDRVETIAGDVTAGTYMVSATCLEKATGTIEVEVKPAS